MLLIALMKKVVIKNFYHGINKELKYGGLPDVTEEKNRFYR